MKTKLTLAIDRKLTTGGAGSVLDAATPSAPPAISTVDAPDGLALTTGLLRSATTPMAYISATWNRPVDYDPTEYVIEASTDANFATGTTVGRRAAQASATIDGLTTATLYYVRVAAVLYQLQSAWSSVASLTTAADTTPPDPVTSQAASFSANGDLLITWTNPTSANLKDIEIRVYTANGGTLLRTAYAAATSYLYTAAQNRVDTSGAPDASLYVILRARSWNNVMSATRTITVTKAAPTTPGSVTVDFTGPSLIMTWAAVTDGIGYRLTLDGIARDVVGLRYEYPLNLNRQEHGGTPDPVISYSLVSVDGLDQISVAATGTATNAAPATVSVSLTAFFNTIAISLGTSTATDLHRYRVRVYRDAGLIDTIWGTATLLTYAATTSGSYTADVAVEDVFAQLSPVTTSSAAVLDGLTIAELRGGIRYRDNLGTNPATLKAALADDSISTATPSYADGIWAWAEATNDWEERYQAITIGAALNMSLYVATSSDGNTWSYWSGPLTNNRVLTSVANQAAAESAAFTPTSTSVLFRVDLPTIVAARFVRLYHRFVGSTHTLREFYPRRIVQSDDIQAEAIKAINIAAASITADRLSVSSLSAISANLGTITAGSISAVTITSSTITGGTIRTAASGARVEMTSTGLRTYDSTGAVQVEATTSTDGVLTAGAGAVTLNQNGLQVLGNNDAFGVNYRRGIVFGAFLGTTTKPNGYLRLSGGTSSPGPPDSNLTLEASSGSNAFGDGQAGIILRVTDPLGSQSIDMRSPNYAGGGGTITLTATETVLTGTLSAGMASFTNNGPSLRLYGTNHTYVAYYPDGAGPGRRGYIGYPSASDDRMTIANEISGAAINLLTSGGGAIQHQGTQILTTRRTGWGAPTGTLTRTTFATGSVTLVQLAERVAALITDLTTHGLIGA
jgi:hypothetical protein